MRKLLIELEKLKRGEIKKVVDERINEFKLLGAGTSLEIFKELCFCLLTANFNAERAIVIQKAIGDGFLNLSERRLASELRRLGYRYPNTRAKYIIEARPHKDSINIYVGRPTSYIRNDEARDWVVNNIKGLGYKEASHFLRNIGHTDYAIIDFHIIDLLARHKLLARPKTLTKANYLDIEKLLRKIAKNSNLNLAELDLYLWFTETGKVLK